MGRALSCCFFILHFVSISHAETRIDDIFSFDLKSWYRHETDPRTYTNPPVYHIPNLLRTEIGFRLNENEGGISFYVQLRNTNLFNKFSTAHRYQDDIYFQEAWLRIDRIFQTPFSVQGGRFAMQHGRDRIIGYDDWSLFGRRAYNGVHLRYIKNNYELGVLAAKVWNRGVVRWGGARVSASVWGGFEIEDIVKEIFNIGGD